MSRPRILTDEQRKERKLASEARWRAANLPRVRAAHREYMAKQRLTPEGRAKLKESTDKYLATPKGKKFLAEKALFRCVDCKEPADLARTLCEGRKIGPYRWICPECDL